VHYLERRGRVVPEATQKLGMKKAEAGEIVLLSAGDDS
jgi:hypothetical protein